MNNQKTISELRIPVRTKFDAEGQPVRRPEAGGCEARMVQTIREFDPGRKELIRLACDAARRIDEITLEDIRYCMSCTHPRVRIETVGAAASFVQGYVTRIEALEAENRRLASLHWELQGINHETTLMLSRLTAKCDQLREALQGLMQAVDGCLTPSEALLWKKCEEALEGAE